MTTFQLIGMSLCGILVAIAAYRAVRKRDERLGQLGWLLVFSAGFAAFVDPDMTRKVAASLGVTRGADLVSYLTTLALLFFAFWLQGRLRHIERNLTIVAREIAVLGARSEQTLDRTPPDGQLTSSAEGQSRT